jgi:hypothetical protein
MFAPPAGIDDLIAKPDLRQAFMTLWNDSDGEFLGSYVAAAAQRSKNYVDPRVIAPTSAPVKIPWNGFPRALSRWYDDESSTAGKEQAEVTADVATPILSWIEVGADGPRLREIEAHRLPFFGAAVKALARPLRRVLPDGTLGPEVRRMRRQQDEYLEWHTIRDAAGRLVALTFTAEPPDYWMALARIAPDRVVDLYRALVGPEVQKDDVFFPTDLAAFGVGADGQPGWFNIGRKGVYDELNRWTTIDGIVHLTHRANTLGAEVSLAADGSHVWRSDLDPPPVDPNAPKPEIRRIACGDYGGINRSSDPLIGHGVGGAVGQGARVTLTDPIGLYVANADIGSLRGPQGQPVGKGALSVVRGDDDVFDPRILRVEVKLPAGAPFRLDECTLDGRRLIRGGQVARLTTMHLYAQTYTGGADPAPQTCRGRVCWHASRSALFTIGDPAEGCPDAQDLLWLFETPAEPAAAGSPQPLASAAAVAPPATVKGTAAIAVKLPTTRAHRKP